MASRSTPLVCSGHTRPITQLQFSTLQPGDQNFYLVSSCKDGSAMLRDGMTGDWIGSFKGHKGCAWSAKLSSNVQRAVTGSADFSAKLWNAESGECLETMSHNHIVRAVDINHDGSIIITGGHEKQLRLFDVTKPTEPSLFKTGDAETSHSGTIRSVVWDEKNQMVVSAAEDKTLIWWDSRTLQPIQEIKFDDAITSMERSHDASLVSVTTGKRVIFYDVETRTESMAHKLDYTPSTASLNPITVDTFVTGSTADGWVRVHSASSGEELEVFKGHHGPVHSISYSPDGELYASGSEDGTIRLWQTTRKTYGLWRYPDA